MLKQRGSAVIDLSRTTVQFCTPCGADLDVIAQPCDELVSKLRTMRLGQAHGFGNEHIKGRGSRQGMSLWIGVACYSLSPTARDARLA